MRGDTKAALLLTTVIALSVMLFLWTGRTGGTAETADTTGNRKPDAGRGETAAGARSNGGSQFYAVPTEKVALSAFDPNTADSTTLLRMGLQPWQVRAIYRFRAKGGVYSQKEDFAFTPGLTKKKYRELEPFISISPDYQPAALTVRQRKESVGDSTTAAKANGKLQKGATLELNSADTTALRRVPGIGQYYARKIAERRKRLGGFVSTSQLDEIEDFPEEAKAFFTVDSSRVKRISVNSTTLSELRRHPYIGFYLARDIVEARRLHGSIRSIGELLMLESADERTIKRLEPYLEFQP